VSVLFMPDSASKPSGSITLENPELTATVRLRGAELCSLRDRATGEEFIWQNPTGEWAGSSPILFPFVGRVRSGGFDHAGQRLSLIHI
jgi:galactose mutarotase-like enzyme